MPENRYFTVTQERSVKVSATDIFQAATLANMAFKDETIDSGSVLGWILGPVREIDLYVREDD